MTAQTLTPLMSQMSPEVSVGQPIARKRDRRAAGPGDKPLMGMASQG
jgi:hypothetical protein